MLLINVHRSKEVNKLIVIVAVRTVNKQAVNEQACLTMREQARVCLKN
jgi:hypothetical protein